MTRIFIPFVIALATAALHAQQPEPAWSHAADKRDAMSAEETRAFMKSFQEEEPGADGDAPSEPGELERHIPGDAGTHGH